MLDHRIAHGIARNSLAQVEDIGILSGGTMKDLYIDKLARKELGVLPETDKGARRKLQEVVKVLGRHALAFETGEDKKYRPYFTCLSLERLNPADITKPQGPFAHTEDCITLGWYRTYTRRDSFALHCMQMGRSVAQFTVHAVARHHQRDGNTDWRAVAASIRETIPVIWGMLSVYKECALRQVFVSTSTGVFVGEPLSVMQHNGILQFRTFLLGETLSPRWQVCQSIIAAFQNDSSSPAVMFAALVNRQLPDDLAKLLALKDALSV